MEKALMVKPTPIHDIPDDEIDLILEQAKKFIEWEIEPKFCQLEYLIHSIKNSYIYFFPEDDDLMERLDIKTAELVLTSFKNGETHPLHECLIALVKIFNVINSDGKTFKRFQIKYPINDYLAAIRPFILEEKLQKYSKAQSEKGGKPRTTRGLTPEQRNERDNAIRQQWKTSRLSRHGFATKKAEETGLSVTAIKKIIKK